MNVTRVTMMGTTVALSMAISTTSLAIGPPIAKNDTRVLIGPFQEVRTRPADDAYTDIRPTVEVGVGFSQKLGTAWFELRAGNQPIARNAIACVTVARLGRPEAVHSSTQWLGSHFKNSGAVTWLCIDTLSDAPTSWRPTIGRLSPFMIQPGDTTHVFRLYVGALPRVLHVYMQGFDTLSTAGLATEFEAGWRSDVVLPASVVDETRLPTRSALEPTWTDPSTRSTSVGYSLSRPSSVELRIVDAHGGVVRELARGDRRAGRYAVLWDGTGPDGRAAGPGVYRARLEVDGKPIASRWIAITR